MNLLTTKFHVPQPQNLHLVRHRLIEKLELGVRNSNRLTLLVAPAGFGKTTLISTWLAANPHRIAWLSLDSNDNLLSRFIFYLVKSLQPHLPGLEEALNLGQDGQEPPVELILTNLLNAAALLAEPVLVVLEDYHLAGNSQTDQALAFLLDHSSPQLHLVITSRQDPTLPLSRLRVRGQLTEIRAEDLRFTRPPQC